jgi:hypothetical protein
MMLLYAKLIFAFLVCFPPSRSDFMLLDLPDPLGSVSGLPGINIIMYWLVWIFRANKQINIYHYHFTISRSLLLILNHTFLCSCIPNVGNLIFMLYADIVA